MNAREKRKFVGDLIGAVKRDIQAKLDKVPDEWDGHELRQLISDMFRRETTLEHKSNSCRRRLNDYRKSVAFYGI